MIDEQFCTHCTEKKVKVFSHMRKLKRIYIDQDSKEWHGARCPQCYETYKKNYDAARRIKKGHMPMGSICVCEDCGKQYELTQGHRNNKCPNC